MKKPSFATTRSTGSLYANLDNRYEVHVFMNDINAASFTKVFHSIFIPVV